VSGIFLSLIIVFGCETRANHEVSAAFSMSDTMMARCEFFKIRSEEVKNEIRFFGKISADKNKMAQVYNVVGGNVTEIRVEVGDYVKQGQILASMRNSEVAEFEKEKFDAINDVANAEKNLQVTRDLFTGKLSSEKDLTAAERELEKARAELKRINEIYKIYNLKDGSVYNITAPLSGFIVTKNINKNEQLRPDQSDPLFSIAEINEVWALANVNESDISKVNMGYDAEIRTLSFPDEVYKGKVDKIFNAIDPETKAMKIRVKIPNADFRLKPDMNATMTVRYTEPRQMVAVPSSAVIFDKSKYWVMVFHDRYNIETRKVDVYRQLGETTYIERGLVDGEKVISRNGILIYDALND
jgi:membrane fusion protein, heavy metal efflux system